jgi:hypothetical protein
MGVSSPIGKFPPGCGAAARRNLSRPVEVGAQLDEVLLRHLRRDTNTPAGNRADVDAEVNIRKWEFPRKDPHGHFRDEDSEHSRRDRTHSTAAAPAPTWREPPPFECSPSALRAAASPSPSSCSDRPIVSAQSRCCTERAQRGAARRIAKHPVGLPAMETTRPVQPVYS